MNGLLNFIIAFIFVALGTIVLLGKGDAMMANYRIAFKGGKLRFVKRREYKKSARPLYALLCYLLALISVLEYILRPIPEHSAIIALAVIIPIILVLELKYRK
jgi:hypothetical protein